MTSLSYSWPLVFSMFSVAGGFTVAGTVLVSQHNGAGNDEKRDYAAAQTVGFVGLVALVCNRTRDSIPRRLMIEAHALDVERLRLAVDESVQAVVTTGLNNPLREEASAFARGRDPGRSALFTAAVGEQYGVVAPMRVTTVVELQRLHAVCHAEERRVLVGDGFRSLADWVLLDGPWSLSGRLAGVGELANATEYLNGSLLGSRAEYIDAWLAENAAKLAVSLFSLSDTAPGSVREIGREVRREEEWCISGVLEDAPPRVEAAFRAVSGTRRR